MRLVGYDRTSSASRALCCTGKLLLYLAPKYIKIIDILSSMSPPPPRSSSRQAQHARPRDLHVCLYQHPRLAAFEKEHGRFARQRPQLRGALVHLSRGDFALLATLFPLF